MFIFWKFIYRSIKIISKSDPSKRVARVSGFESITPLVRPVVRRAGRRRQEGPCPGTHRFHRQIRTDKLKQITHNRTTPRRSVPAHINYTQQRLKITIHIYKIYTKNNALKFFFIAEKLYTKIILFAVDLYCYKPRYKLKCETFRKFAFFMFRYISKYLNNNYELQ